MTDPTPFSLADLKRAALEFAREAGEKGELGCHYLLARERPEAPADKPDLTIVAMPNTNGPGVALATRLVISQRPRIEQVVLIMESWQAEVAEDNPYAARLDAGQISLKELPPELRSSVLTLIWEQRDGEHGLEVYPITELPDGRRQLALFSKWAPEAEVYTHFYPLFPNAHAAPRRATIGRN